MEEKKLKPLEKTEDEAWEALQKVRQAEERARLLIEKTKQKSSPEVIRKATEEADELRKKILAEAKIKAESQKKDIIARAESQARQINQQMEEEKQQLIKIAQANFSQAVEQTVNKILAIIENWKG
ncbi:MAG: hypothetical protein ACPLZD_02615 [Candidatus Saccharicenans sp.]|nr:MAG: hypothetical protein C0168_04450 [Candidatus Aminicenantes bacterium]HEK85389.1 hypothetical protein [Candidatus Aminicenantes bacterium]